MGMVGDTVVVVYNHRKNVGVWEQGERFVAAEHQEGTVVDKVDLVESWDLHVG